MDLTSEELKRLLTYDPKTGIFRWKVARQRIRPRQIAGVIHKGYRIITINQKRYRAARLAILYMTGEWPKGEADHRDRNPSNDKWLNLRDLTRHQNQMNKTAKGVTKRPNGTWSAYIGYKGKNIALGTFPTEGEALIARAAGKALYHHEVM